MNRNKSLVIVSLLIFLLIVSGCSSSNNSEDDVTLKFNNTSTSDPHREFGENFADLIDEKTDGEVEVETYFGDSVAEYGIQPVQTGTVDFNQVIPSNAADLSEKLTLLDAPYVYEDIDHALKAVEPESPIVEDINKEISEEGVRFITAYPMGFRHITTDKEVKSPDDFKGMKLRVVPSEIYQDTIDSFGASPTPMPFSEVATSLATGAIDGQENPWSATVPNGLHETQDYIAETGHIMSFAGIFMNNEKYESLSDENKEAINEAADEAIYQFTEDILDSEEEWKDEAEDEGMEIINEENGLDKKAFENKAEEVKEEYKESWGDLYDELLELGDD